MVCLSFSIPRVSSKWIVHFAAYSWSVSIACCSSGFGSELFPSFPKCTFKGVSQALSVGSSNLAESKLWYIDRVSFAQTSQTGATTSQGIVYLCPHTLSTLSSSPCVPSRVGESSSFTFHEVSSINLMSIMWMDLVPFLTNPDAVSNM